MRMGGRAGSAPAHRPARVRAAPHPPHPSAGPPPRDRDKRRFPARGLSVEPAPGERRGSRKSSSVDAQIHQINYRLIDSDKCGRIFSVFAYGELRHQIRANYAIYC